MTVFTVTVSGGEELDGEAPFLYVVSAADDQEAARIAGAAYERDQEQEWTSLTTAVGLPEYGNFNDLRPGADAVAFFREHAGFSRLPDESDAEAKERSARELADAEEWMHNAGYTVGWAFDLDDDHTNGHPTYVCTLYADDGEIVGSLGGVDLADVGTAHPYARVVEAELAAEHAPR